MAISSKINFYSDIKSKKLNFFAFCFLTLGLVFSLQSCQSFEKNKEKEEIKKLLTFMDANQELIQIDVSLFQNRVDSNEKYFFPSLDKYLKVINNDDIKSKYLKISGMNIVYHRFLDNYPFQVSVFNENYKSLNISKNVNIQSENDKYLNINNLMKLSKSNIDSLTHLVNSIRVLENDYQRNIPEIREIYLKMK